MQWCNEERDKPIEQGRKFRNRSKNELKFRIWSVQHLISAMWGEIRSPSLDNGVKIGTKIKCDGLLTQYAKTSSTEEQRADYKTKLPRTSAFINYEKKITVWLHKNKNFCPTKSISSKIKCQVTKMRKVLAD